MTKTLFAACRTDEGLVVKHVRVSLPVQLAVGEMFEKQEEDFMRGITEEVAFDGGWKPDEDQLLTIDLAGEARVFTETIATETLSVPDLDAANLADENVRALFVGDKDRVLVQRFAPPQVLSRRFSLLLDDNTFKRLEQPAFAFDTRLTFIIRDGKIKFKSFHTIRQIIDLLDLYQVATDQGVAEFARKPILNVGDIEQFKQNADQTCRKLIYAISRDGVLDRHSADAIVTAAAGLGLAVGVTNGRLDLPPDRAGLKQLLHFLNDGLYEAPLSGERYVTNSKQKVKAAA